MHRSALATTLVPLVVPRPGGATVVACESDLPVRVAVGCHSQTLGKTCVAYDQVVTPSFETHSCWLPGGAGLELFS